MRRRWATWLGTNVFARTAWNVRGHTCQVTRVRDKFLTEVAMMDESVQMSLVHFIATRRPNRNGWDKEVFALKKAWRSSPLEFSICNTPCRPCFKTMVGDYGVAAA